MHADRLFQSIPFHIDCIPEFQIPAKYAITMLGLIGGFLPSFTPNKDEDGMITYGYGDQNTSPTILASRVAHQFLLRKGEYYPASAHFAKTEGSEFLSLFPTEASGVVNEDFIAATFFFLSQHEEWSISKRDEFDRFPAKESLLGKLNALDRPVVAEYAAVLKHIARKLGYQITDSPRYRECYAAMAMTHDIDYMRKFTPGLLYRESVKHLLLNQVNLTLPKRIKRFVEFVSYADPKRDPYKHSLREIIRAEKRMNVRATFFFKSGGTDKRDTRYSLAQPFVRSSLTELQSEGHCLGLHPSFRSYDNPTMMDREKERLNQAVGSPITGVRQHYLRHKYPVTHRLHSACGFMFDSTLGFAEKEGFRTGTCHPYLPFDLGTMEVIPVWQFPLTVMDGTLAFYQHLSSATSFERILVLMETVRRHCGVFVPLFHNTISDSHDFPGWQKTFEDTLHASITGKLYCGTLPEVHSAWLGLKGKSAESFTWQMVHSISETHDS